MIRPFAQRTHVPLNGDWCGLRARRGSGKNYTFSEPSIGSVSEAKSSLIFKHRNSSFLESLRRLTHSVTSPPRQFSARARRRDFDWKRSGVTLATSPPHQPKFPIDRATAARRLCSDNRSATQHTTARLRKTSEQKTVQRTAARTQYSQRIRSRVRSLPPYRAASARNAGRNIESQAQQVQGISRA
jgi:hypothetical protein